MIYRLTRQQIVPAPLREVWRYFSTHKNLNIITPPDMHFEIIHGADRHMHQGQLIEYGVQIIPMIKSRWLTEISHVEQNASFVDEQRIGPYKFWYHEHRFDTVGGGTSIRDNVTYQLPFGLLGDIVHSIWVRRQLQMIFEYRTQKVSEIFGHT